MKRFLFQTLLLLTFTSSVFAQEDNWFPFKLDSNTTVLFPDFPLEKDTLNQKIFSVLIQQDLMLAIKIDTPSDSLTDSTAWNRWMEEYILQNTEGSKIILREASKFHEFPAIYYKFQTFNGLQSAVIAENYLVKASGKLYHFAYWRLQPQTVANEIRMKRYFDNITITDNISMNNNPTEKITNETFSTTNEREIPWLIIIVVILISVIIYLLFEKYKNKKSSN